MKKTKCSKCVIYFKDRKDNTENNTTKKLCWYCKFIWEVIDITLQALPEKIKQCRKVVININDIKIKKISKKDPTIIYTKYEIKKICSDE